MIQHLIVIIVVGFSASFALSHEPRFSDRTDIIHILESYSERTGVRFVIDPRVKARVNMDGLDIDKLTKANLIDILAIHAFTTYENGEVVYVLPLSAADFLGSDIGETWGSQQNNSGRSIFN